MSRVGVRGLGVATALAVVLLHAAAGRAADRVNDGAPLTPEFAQDLFNRVSQVREPDSLPTDQLRHEPLSHRHRAAVGVRHRTYSSSPAVQS
jgi:hypothetical protein